MNQKANEYPQIPVKHDLFSCSKMDVKELINKFGFTLRSIL